MAPSSSEAKYPQLAAGPVGKQIHNIAKDRLGQFTDTGGQYRNESLMSKLYEGRASDDHVKLYRWSAPNLSRPTFKEATSHDFAATKKGEWFGPSWSTHWFKIHVTVPSDLREKDHLEFHWDAHSEGLIWTTDGDPVHGLTGNGERTEWILPKKFRDGKEHVFYIEMACNGMFGNAPGGDIIQPPQEDKYFQLSTADIVAVNLDARQLHMDFWIIGDGAREFPEESWQEHEALQVCGEIMDHFIKHGGSKKCIKECRKIAQKYLGSKVDSPDQYRDDENIGIVNGIGHCHIDTCWLWPWAETKRKIARSWASQCDLIDRYPEYRFCASQAQQYKWLKMYYPMVYDRVKQKIKEGTFHPIGGSWVEHDTNMPSGESLVRQFLYGQRFFESHFGERCTTFWLPDTFGYSTQLPQLCRLSGMTRFFTQKLSWNNINKFPHTTFNWVSLDGSQVICHMAPSETYTAEAHFGDVKRSVSQHKSLDQDATSLLVFGKGDGGGGPTWQHIEKLRRCRGISEKVGLLPKVHMGSSVDEFFDRLEKKAANGHEFVTWYGELYFELHRGTYTTQANNKRNNRFAEVMLRDLEYLATMATIKDKDYKYPKKDIDDMWEGVLLCQFHDCLPGSSIEMCYDDSDELYEEIFETGERRLAEAMNVLGFGQPGKDDGELVAVNLLPWARSEVAKLPKVGNMASYGHFGGATGAITVQQLPSAPANSASIKELSKGVFEMSNHRLKLKIEHGAITSIYDTKHGRELVAHGKKANQLVIFDDKPLYWQAWDVEVYHLNSRRELPMGEARMVENGPHRVSVVTETKISDKSWAKMTISLNCSVDEHDHPLTAIDVDCECEWQEDKKFLKVEFPVTITNSEASYETQYGIIRRPTHYNTTWDMAKFEVCCHKWADLSEATYGVSILNDQKYGFATCGNVMRLSLLRAPKAPDAHADMGRHHMRWAILPHVGPLDHRTVRRAFEFNNPLRLRSHANPQAVTSLLGSLRIEGSPGIIIDTVKRGEDDHDVSRGELPKRKGRSVVVRLYDAVGGAARVKLHFGKLNVKEAWKTNCLEDDEDKLELCGKGGNGTWIHVRAFEVATYRLVLDD